MRVRLPLLLAPFIWGCVSAGPTSFGGVPGAVEHSVRRIDLPSNRSAAPLGLGTHGELGPIRCAGRVVAVEQRYRGEVRTDIGGTAPVYVIPALVGVGLWTRLRCRGRIDAEESSFTARRVGPFWVLVHSDFVDVRDWDRVYESVRRLATTTEQVPVDPVTFQPVVNGHRRSRVRPRGTTVWTGSPPDGIALTRVSYRVPEHWADDGLLATERRSFAAPGGFHAGLLTSLAERTSADLRPPDVHDPFLVPAPDEGRARAWIWAVRPEVALPVDWMLAWDGLAEAQLPPWTDRFDRIIQPYEMHDAGPGSVALSVGGALAGAPLRVDAVFVRRSGWVIAVAVAGRDGTDRRDLARHLAASIRASTR